MNNLRKIPSVDLILQQDSLKQIAEEVDPEKVTTLIREVLQDTRKRVSKGETPPQIETIVERIIEIASTRWKSWPQAVINATGVILHTNLGRSPISKESILSAGHASEGYSDLELDLVTGKRGSRQAQVSQLICDLVGSEAAIIVNNNAAALILGLASIANGKSVIVSRSEAVEIGGGFRIPDVLAQSGSRLVEVGTTNRTYVEDYENAITENTAAILKVHRSNFEIVGFTHTPEERDLSALSNRFSIPLINDLGSGCLIETSKYGLDPEPTVKEAVGSGADLALFSGDKLLGGPQAGIIVGKKFYVDKLKVHPLARAVRIDKLDLAALTATLIPYLTGDFESEIPIWRMISASLESLDTRAKSWAKNIGISNIEILDGQTAVGGGSLPGQMLDTRNLMIPRELCGPGGAEMLAEKLRTGPTPVVSRVSEDNLLLDVRTVLPEQDADLCTALSDILN